MILLVVDTLRADHLGLYGYDRPTSPALDRFAVSATVFEQVLAPSSWTLPSVASLMTSTYPTVHGIRERKGGSIRGGLSTLPEELTAAGYRTVAAVANPWVSTRSGSLTTGYDQFEKMDTASADELHEFARAALDIDDPRPTFVYLHYMDIHGPFNTQGGNEDLGPISQAYVRKMNEHEIALTPAYYGLEGSIQLGDYIEAYDQGIRRWDQSLGSFIQWLDRTGRLDHTVVVLVSDHGEEFLEHGNWNHGHTLFQEQLFVPWIIYLPGEPGRRLASHPVSLIDVAPTLLALIGAQPPTTMLGVDVLSGDIDSSRPLFSETDIRRGERGAHTPQRTMLRGSHKTLMRLTVRGKKRQRKGRLERVCFDLERDPGELDPIPSNASDSRCGDSEFDELAAWEHAMQQQADRLGEAGHLEFSEEEKQELRALGYTE